MSTINEQEYLGLESLIRMFSANLPSRGGVNPIITHKMPIVPINEIDSTI